MAQRMESVAPPGGVMLSVSTARLVQDVAVLGEPELVRIKGSDVLVPRVACWGSSRGGSVGVTLLWLGASGDEHRQVHIGSIDPRRGCVVGRSAGHRQEPSHGKARSGRATIWNGMSLVWD